MAWIRGTGSMAMHLEFMVQGPPVSNQQRTPQGKANLRAWRATVAGVAQNRWGHPVLRGALKAILINFHDGDEPPVDVDNMSKPILDCMEQVVYDDDRQIRQAEIIHVNLKKGYLLTHVSAVIVDALRVGVQFVYIRIEDPIDPYPLPG